MTKTKTANSNGHSTSRGKAAEGHIPTATANDLPLVARIEISEPQFNVVSLRIVGTAPLVQCAFSEKAMNLMKRVQAEGVKARGKKGYGGEREAKDFDQLFEQSLHRSTEGWEGIPAAAFRNAMVDACRVADVKMTQAKLLVFVEADGVDRVSGQPLVRITKGEPRRHDAAVRVGSGLQKVADIRTRAMFDPGWEAIVRVKFDAQFIDLRSVVNLMMRVGTQVGVGEGRPYSKSSCGQGWGTFRIAMED